MAKARAAASAGQPPAPPLPPDPLEIKPALGARGGLAPCHLTFRPPGSKSLTNRALLLAALASGKSVLRRPLIDADDTQVMLTALRALGAEIRIEGQTSSRVTPSTCRITGRLT